MANIARTSGAGAALLPYHRFTAEGEAYVYATETGGLFRMDDGMREAMSSLASSEASTLSPEILSDLRRAGLVQAEELREKAGRTAHPPLRLRTLVLMLTYSCNLACRYCYEDREEGCAPPADGGGTPREMSPESLRSGVAYLLDHDGQGGPSAAGARDGGSGRKHGHRPRFPENAAG